MSIFQELKVKNKPPLLWEGEYFFSLLDGYPINPGHSLVIPSRELVNLSDLTNTEWIELRKAINKTITTLSRSDLSNKYKGMLKNANDEKSIALIKDAILFLNSNKFSPDAYNHGINDGIAAGRTVNHLHWHVIPRFENDVKDPTGGVRYIFPDKANYK